MSTRRAVQLGRLGGVPIALAPTWPVSLLIVAGAAALLGGRLLPGRSPGVHALAGLILAVLLLVSVLVHELGHVVAARVGGQRVLGVRFDVLGGRTDVISDGRSPGTDALVALAGPIGSLVVAGIAFGAGQLADAGGVATLVLNTVWVINVLLAVFNLLPAAPLDGGELLRSGVWRLTGSRRAGELAGLLGAAIVVAALTGLAAWQWLDGGRPARIRAVVLTILVAHLAIELARTWQRRRRREGEFAEASMTTLPPGMPVVLPGDGPREFAELLSNTGSAHFQLVDDDGLPQRVLARSELAAILAGLSGSPSDPRPDPAPRIPPGRGEATR